MIPISNAFGSFLADRVRPTRRSWAGRRAQGLVWGLVLAGMVSGSSARASAEVVSGRLVGLLTVPRSPTRSGYLRTPITDPSPRLPPARRGLALFLRVKESLPLVPGSPSDMALDRLALEPGVVACAVDGKVALKNLDREPATFVVAGAVLGPVAPGASVEYECTAGARGEELRRVEVREWPLVRGTIYVGEVGVPGTPKADGSFRIEAPKGTYTLQVVGLRGVLLERDLEVGDRPLDAGAIEVGASDQP